MAKQNHKLESFHLKTPNQSEDYGIEINTVLNQPASTDCPLQQPLTKEEANAKNEKAKGDMAKSDTEKVEEKKADPRAKFRQGSRNF